jgi:hypothetical protein
MSPSSPSPPPASSKSNPASLARQETAQKRPAGSRSKVQETPKPIQATSTSILQDSHEDETRKAEDHRRQRQRQEESEEEDEDEEEEESEDDETDEDDTYPEPDPGESIHPPPNFAPFFTLITSPQPSNDTVHPHVYYVFSDDAEVEKDGHDVATVAALRALDQTAQEIQRNTGQGPKDVVPDDEVEERFILLDLEQNESEDPGYLPFKGHAVSSLSPHWAVTKVEIRNTPTFEEEPDDEDDTGEKPLMLHIEGVELGDNAEEASRRRIKSKDKKEDGEKRAVEVLDEARKRAGAVLGAQATGTVLQGMDELWRGMGDGIGVLEKVMGPAPIEKEK